MKKSIAPSRLHYFLARISVLALGILGITGCQEQMKTRSKYRAETILPSASPPPSSVPNPTPAATPIAALPALPSGKCYGGDANRDLRIGQDDYARIQEGVAKGLSGWNYGDFNGDQGIDADDYFILNSNYSRFMSGNSASVTIHDCPAPLPSPSPSGEMLGIYSKPSATTTGLTNPGILTRQTTQVVTTSENQVIKDLDFDGVGITFMHNNVTVTNCRFRNRSDGGGYFTTNTWPEAEATVRSGIRVEHSDMSGANNALMGYGGGISLYRNYIHHHYGEDFWRNPSDATWEGNYFEYIEVTEGDQHIDLIQWYWGNPANRVSTANFKVYGNYFNLRLDYPLAGMFNAIMMMDGRGPGKITWEYNWMKSGGYVLRVDNLVDTKINHNIWEGWGWGPIVSTNGFDKIEFNGNQVWRNGTLQPFEKSPGPNGDLFRTVPWP